jgi:hypothetical protein
MTARISLGSAPALALVAAWLPCAEAAAHAVRGNRIFPATLGIDR